MRGIPITVVAVALAALGYGVYQYRVSVPTSRLETDNTRRLRPVSSVKNPVGEQLAKLGTVKVSDTVLDFGQVPLGYPAKQTLVVLNSGDAEVEIKGAGLSAPFSSEPGSVALASQFSAGIEVTFDPAKPGIFEQRLRLRVEKPAGDSLEVMVRGEAIPSPISAGITIPPPPDAALRAYQEQVTQDLVAQARQQTTANGQPQHAGAVPGQAEEAQGVEPEEQDSAQTPSDDRSARDSESRQAEEERRARQAVEVVAFGLIQQPGEDINKIPAPIPQGDTKPDLPPPPATKTSEHTNSGTGTEEGTDGGSGGETKDGGTSSDATKGPEEKKIIPTFTVAPNSSVLVYSSKGPLNLQALPVRATSDGSVFELDGRIRFPELALAFGEIIGLKQWGNAQGVVSVDGNVEMGLTLRLDDPNGAMVLDLPIKLTTKMTIGYSAEGRLMFANGVPRDPTTGDFKLVGIANIPLGTGGSLDKAPVVVELLGRLTM
jgi:hypothetical protein